MDNSMRKQAIGLKRRKEISMDRAAISLQKTKTTML